MNENGTSEQQISSCFTRCEDISFSLMSSEDDRQRKRLFEKLYESFKYSDKFSSDSQTEIDILNSITGFSKALAEGQYEQFSYEALESKVNEFVAAVTIRNKRLLESKRGAY